MKVTAGSGNSYELAPAGTYPARCIRVVDLGTQETKFGKKRQVYITWEIDELMESGKPFVVSSKYTASINDKSNLGKDLNQWRGKPFTDEERREFELFSILGHACMLSVEQNQSGEKTYANVGGVLPLPKAMPCPDQVNESFSFDIEDIGDEEKLGKLWGLERYLIERSSEFVNSGFTMPEKKSKEEEDDGEYVPF